PEPRSSLHDALPISTAPACCSWTGWRGRTRSSPGRCISRPTAARRRDLLSLSRYRDGIMNLTVGPLPPAVYWRRRALVAGGLLRSEEHTSELQSPYE